MEKPLNVISNTGSARGGCATTACRTYGSAAPKNESHALITSEGGPAASLVLC